MKIKCLIVDDELAAREGLKALCEEHEDLSVVGVCKNGIEAIDEIRALRPELVLLDVQMPGVDGFEVVASIPKPIPKIIFITAHDQFAIKAFEVNAVDYLLKPFSDERFEQAIHRALEQIRLNKTQNTQELLSSARKADTPDTLRASEGNRLVLKVDGSIHLIDKATISHVEAFDYYVKIHVSGRFFLIRETMKNMERSLTDDRFKRIHKSFIVNRLFVKTMHRIQPTEYELILNSTEHLKVSRSKINEVKDWLGK